MRLAPKQVNLFGNVISCELIMDKSTSKSRGFAFVQMGTEEDATRAIADFNGKKLDGLALTVNKAKLREERPRRRAAFVAREEWIDTDAADVPW